ncbi:hypothetical protein BOTCAL_0366g00090 [Botryotinia calthae]|uniref:Cytochrome P450 n=1 Tax=Botryotinia calthae TaxID=38488 RepID=A0A4Y8CU76_9HELO|nr:hypothetical protein BOTCAL_0366g00090 [Botryotinia calthae]
MWFFDTSTALIFGNSINTLEPEKGQFDTEKFLAAFDIALQGIGLRIALGKFAFLQSLDRSWKKARDEIYTFIDQQIDRAIERAEESSSPNRRLVLLDELLKMTQDRVSLRSQLLNIFLPARHQTAIAVGNIFFHLTRHPEVWSRLRNETSNYDGPLTYEALKQMKYAKAIVNECLSILAPSGRSIRSCSEACILPTGGGPDGKGPVLVTRGTEVNYIFRSMHLDKDIWGPDADEFRPERWEKLGAAQLRAYIPFSKGDQVCLAQQMVLNECLHILVRFAREFRSIENRDSEIRFVEQHKLQMERRHGVKVGFGAISNCTVHLLWFCVGANIDSYAINNEVTVIRLATSAPNKETFKSPYNEKLSLDAKMNPDDGDLEDQEDQSNPLNWSVKVKWTIVASTSIMTTIAPQILKKKAHEADKVVGDIALTTMAEVFEDNYGFSRGGSGLAFLGLGMLNAPLPALISFANEESEAF